MTTNLQPPPHFSGRRLTIARVVWVVAVLLYFGIYLAAGRVYLQPPSTPDLAHLAPSGWTLEEFQIVLGQVGLSPETYSRLLAWATFLSA